MTDARYSIRREWCGYPEPKWVVRFCGEWVDCADTKSDALDAAQLHRDAFRAAVGI